MTSKNTALERLRADGYVVLPGAYDADATALALARIRALSQSAGWQRDAFNKTLDERHEFLWNPQNKDFLFLRLLFENTGLIETTRTLLNDPYYRKLPPDAPNFILRSYLARSSRAMLPLHIDSMVPYRGDDVFVVQCAIILEDQTRENGCLQVVPRSHLSGRWADPADRSAVVDIQTRAGDLVIWDARIWHGSGENTTGGTRWCLIATFCRWWLKQMFDLPGSLPGEYAAQLTDWQKAIMGFCSLPSYDEHGWIDMKRGYEAL